MRIATAAWPIDRHDTWLSYAEKAERWVAEAAEKWAELLVLPEYGSVELASLTANGGDLKQSLAELQPFFTGFAELWAALAVHYETTILAPSFPVLRNGRYLNEAWIFTPEGDTGCQAKLHMTRFEDESWGISAAKDLTVFDLSGLKLGIAICYDVEFAGQVEALGAAGAEVILVPSCTDTDAGYTRVSITARARAIENQCFVIQSSTVGEASWSPAVDVNTGAGGVFGPADKGFPPSGIIAQGKYNTPGWTYADLDFAALAEVRKNGQVLNHRDQTQTAYGTPLLLPLKRTP